MGNTFTAWVVMVAAMLACASFVIALALRAPPSPAARRRALSAAAGVASARRIRDVMP
jgi:hypothetical protein